MRKTALIVCAAASALVHDHSAAAPDSSSPTSRPPAPPTNVCAADHPWDKGDQIDLTWSLSSDDADLAAYQVFKAIVQVGDQPIEPEFVLAESIAPGTQECAIGGVAGAINVWNLESAFGDAIDIESFRAAGEGEFLVMYTFRVIAVGQDGQKSAPAETGEPIAPAPEFFDGSRLWLCIILLIVLGAVLLFIVVARSGVQLRVRKIAGLQAVDEAIGRATEMGRPVLFVPGTQDMNDIQTVAGMTILARVARTAAEYGAMVEVPTSRSLVMTASRETMQAAYLAAGQPESFNQDLVYYVTDEQFGFAAYLQGMMVRDRPAACFYMGTFFAESLLLAETGNSVGAIQIAGTAESSQLPFFVAACDYTLIGEEFFAASAYLSGENDQLGSLKGQDVGKLLVAVFMVVGCILATVAEWGGDARIRGIVDFIRETMLT